MQSRSSNGRIVLEVIDRLAAYHGDPPAPPSADPFELILFENVAYLAADDRRRHAFEKLRTTIGTTPSALLKASRASLEAVASGILKGTSADKLRRCAEIATDRFGGDLAAALRGSVTEAKRALRRFPGIGEPGAEKILLSAGIHPFLAPDSNGLRVLVRFGFVEEQPSYAQTYREAQSLDATIGSDVPTLLRAHGLLRLHGRTLCRRSNPACADCPLRTDCDYGRHHAARGT